MKKFLATLLVVGSLLFASTADAEIKTYTGIGEYLMSDFETFDVAQQRAKQRAEQNACEQAGVYVESRTEVRNAQVTKDEIITMTSGILKIVDVQFKREFVDDNTTRIRATITANIDSDDVTKWLAKSAQERSTLVAQNEALRQSIAEQDKQIADLKKQLADVKTQADKDRIKQEIIDIDRKSVNQNEKITYSDFVNIARAVHFVPLYIPQGYGNENYEISELAAKNGVAEIIFRRKYDSNVCVTIRTYRRAEGEELRDISGVSGVKWRIDMKTYPMIYLAKITETQHVAAWTVGQYTFSARGENFTFSGFHKLVTDKLIELSTHYYFDL